MSTITYAVSGVGHGDAAITAKVGALPGVDRVDVRLESNVVGVTGRDLDGGAIHDAIHEAGLRRTACDRAGRAVHSPPGGRTRDVASRQLEDEEVHHRLPQRGGTP